MKTIASDNSFSFQRFLLLIKRTAVFNQKSWIIGIASAFGLLIIIWFTPVLTILPAWHEYRIQSLLTPAIFFYTAGGLVITSSLFNELHSPATAFLNLTLPATAFEKLFSAWLISAVLFTLVTLTGYFLLHLAIQLTTMAIVPSFPQIQLFNPFEPEMFEDIFTYVFYNSLFLLGAVYFKKLNFIKTLLSIILFVFVMGIIAGILSLFQPDNTLVFSLGELNPAITYSVLTAIMLLFLFLNYIRLKNRQVA
jgi:hypothetical protein